VKPGARALGVAESHVADESTLGGALVRAAGTVEAFAFATCTVGGTDATDAVGRLWHRLDREDVRVVLVAGVAPAWFNILDLRRLADATDRPVISVSFEASPGLEGPIREAFDGDAADRRLATYRAQPDRHELTLDGETVFVRAVGTDAQGAAAVLDHFTVEGPRPEPLRVAREAARAVDAFRREID
jgi:endonuclease V-like protein UPF0215 family